MKYPVSINAKFQDDWTAIHYAVNEGNVEIVEFLIKINATLDVVTITKRTSLHIAVYKNSIEIAELLLKR